MLKKTTIQSYINNFRRRIARFLRPGIGLSCAIYPVKAGGAILEFLMGPEIENDDNYQEPVETLGEALSGIEQHAFGGNLGGFNFSGTNLIMESNKIILIKDNLQSEWSDVAADKDVQRILPKNVRGAR